MHNCAKARRNLHNETPNRNLSGVRERLSFPSPRLERQLGARWHHIRRYPFRGNEAAPGYKLRQWDPTPPIVRSDW